MITWLDLVIFVDFFQLNYSIQFSLIFAVITFIYSAMQNCILSLPWLNNTVWNQEFPEWQLKPGSPGIHKLCCENSSSSLSSKHRGIHTKENKKLDLFLEVAAWHYHKEANWHYFFLKLSLGTKWIQSIPNCSIRKNKHIIHLEKSLLWNSCRGHPYMPLLQQVKRLCEHSESWHSRS